MRKILFISDLHLQASEPRITEIFLQFLSGPALEAEALYILGDFFEAWIGDDDLSSYNLIIINAIHQATKKGLPIYFMHGNRDFLIGKNFARRTGISLLPDPTVIELFGVRTLLMHGDSLCTFDIKHQKARRFTLNPCCQWLALRLPLWVRRRGGQWLRGKSRRRLHHTENYIMDVNPEAVDKVMQSYQAQQLIHGHTHRPAIHNLAHGKRIVLGSWHQAGSVLICTDQGNCELKSL